MSKARRLKRGTLSACMRLLFSAAMLLLCAPGAFALNPSLDVSQYAHTAWKVRDGFSKSRITSVAQTVDGYLWLGTEFGLLRFDGVRAVPWQPPTGKQLPSNFIRCVLGARDGTLWIGTTKGLASWKDGKLILHPELAGETVDTLLEDREGTVWAGAGGITTGRLCEIRSGRVQCDGEDGTFGRYVESLFQDGEGNLWVGAMTGLWHWKPGPPKLFSMPVPRATSQTLSENDNGAPLIIIENDIRQFVGGRAEAYPPATGRQFTADKLFRDRNGGLWIGTLGQGLLHVHQGRTDVFSQSAGLSGDVVSRLFEDREGSIWVVTGTGLDRFREYAVPTMSMTQGLSSAIVTSVLATRDGSVWLGTDDGLDRWKDGEITIYRKRSTQRERAGALGAVHQITDRGLPDNAVESLFLDDGGRIWVSMRHGVVYFEDGRFTPVSSVPGGYVNSIAGDNKGNLWIDNQDLGLFHLIRDSVAEQIPWARLGGMGSPYTMLHDSLQDGLWIGFWQGKGGLAYFKDGRARASYTVADGLGEGQIRNLHLDQDGTLWAATQGGLSRVKNGRVATLTQENGLPCDAVDWMAEDDAHSLWMYMACGLVRVARTELDAWVASFDKGPKRMIQVAVFDSSDGVQVHDHVTSYSPRGIKSSDGKLWFLSGDGVSVIDPAHLPFNWVPPPVHVEQVTADRKTYWQNLSGDASSLRLKLPPLVRDLEIDYTALSLVAPEKVRFRYKLEGWDRDWQDAGNRRQAFYTNLSPGDYRFRVAASNNSGVWNEAGASFAFFIAPAYYQTMWFRLSCVAAFLSMLWALYQLRLRQVAQQFKMRMEERVNERMRIARELHDTMLQSFQGAVLHIQVVSDLISNRPQEAKEKLDRALDLADHAIAEGRDAVQGLRSSTTVTNDIAAAMITLGKGLAASETDQNCPEFRVDVVGATRDLHPITRDEVCRIAGEALRNAFKHAQASRIEVEIQYGAHRLRLRIRDDGKGIEPQVVGDNSRQGHYGLPGMRERAKLIGGNLELWSKVQAGTEIELTIPAAAAYAKPDGQHGSRFFRKGAGAD
jgi:signal transduction histidine kinase/ligand-binding sensor domain-containing protein